jgi:P4 family phage/plasmid primase-like protien
MTAAPDTTPDLTAVSALRANLWVAGFRPVPVFNHDADVPDPGKQPLGKGWQDAARMDPPFCAASPAVRHALNTGILGDGQRAIDLDIDDPEKASQCRAEALAILGPAPMRTREGSSRCLLSYRAAEGQPSKITLTGSSHTKEHACKIEVLGKGQQFVAFGRHPSGAELQWTPEAPGDVRLEDLTAVTEDQVQAFLEACSQIIDAPMPVRANGLDHDHVPGEPQADETLIASALAAIPNGQEPADWESWNNIGMALYAATGGSAGGYRMFDLWSARHEQYDEKRTQARWKHYANSPPNAIGAGSIFYRAGEHGWIDPRTANRPPPPETEGDYGTTTAKPLRSEPEPETEATADPPPEDSPGAWHDPDEPPPQIDDPGYHEAVAAAAPKPKRKPQPESLDGFDLTEDGIALAFTKAHQDLLRYDHSIGKWFHWTGKAWRQDETKLAFSWARRTCRQLAKDAEAENAALRTLAKAATAAAVERFAQSDPALAVTSAIWDRDTFLLGTPDGTLDLRTGELRDPVREDHITKLTSVTPSVMPDCPLWLAFLNEVTKGDQTLIRFLKQWTGYCLTGDVSQHALLFAYGPGGNGKGVFVNTISWIMGDYAVAAAMDTFVASDGDRHPTDLAMLRGARMVTASETEEGRPWAEARIKQLTGGDMIRARFMRQDFFEYLPQFKLNFIGNHKPVLKNVDDAAKRRINMAPFLFKPTKVDTKLQEKLQEEAPGILRWIIEGCLDWQKNGLIRPIVVINATAEYFAEQDLVNGWIEDCCAIGIGQYDTVADLFKSWTAYCWANGQKTTTSMWFSQTLARIGYESVKNTQGKNGHRGFNGIAVKHIMNVDRTQSQAANDEAAALPDEDARWPK